MARLQEYYKQTVMADLTKRFGYQSVMEVPRISKITLNMGVGEAVGDKKVLEHAVGDMTKIAGQKPVTTKSKKSIAGFKIREGYPIGCMVTLRGGRMYEFLDRLVTIVLPRIRDFCAIRPDFHPAIGDHFQCKVAGAHFRGHIPKFIGIPHPVEIHIASNQLFLLGLYFFQRRQL